MTPELPSSVGHILFSHPDGKKNTLVPPMQGHGPYSKILNWIKSENARSEFVPSVPLPLAPPEPRFQNFHRLTYRASGTLVLPSSSQRVLKFEIPLEPRDVESDAHVTDADLKHVLQASGTPRMWAGYQSKVNMLMPHRLDETHILSFLSSPFTRPVDIQVTVQDFSLAPDAALPLTLRQYVTELDT